MTRGRQPLSDARWRATMVSVQRATATAVLITLCLLAQLIPRASMAAPPFADVHTHYKWSQQDVTSVLQVIQVLGDNDTQLALMIGAPNQLALQLREHLPNVVLPVWSPYGEGADWSNWAFRPALVQRARQALASGSYHGIGELHLIGGFIPKADSPVINGLLALAAEHQVPVMLHTDISRNRYMLDICTRHDNTTIIWAHAGSILPADDVAAVMAACPNVWMELAARDPWRYVRNPIAGDDGLLLPAWDRVVRRYYRRTLVGTDPVWPVENLDSWDEADTGWQEYARFQQFHRRWLRGMPAAIEAAIRWENAQRLFAPRRSVNNGAVQRSTNGER